MDDETGDAYTNGVYLVFFPGTTADTDIFALAASNFWLLSAMSCFLDLSFAFGDLSPMVIASCSLSSGMLPPFLGKSKTIAAGSMSDSAITEPSQANNATTEPDLEPCWVVAVHRPSEAQRPSPLARKP